MADLLGEVLKHATLANHDDELTSMVVLMVNKGREPEMHMAVAQQDIHQMNTATDMLKMELLRMVSYNSEQSKDRG